MDTRRPIDADKILALLEKRWISRNRGQIRSALKKLRFASGDKITINLEWTLELTSDRIFITTDSVN